VLERFKYPIFAALALALTAGVLALLTSQPPTMTITILPPPPTATPGPLRVYITGAVARPNVLLTLPPGSRQQDAIEAAGGLTAEADLAALNLALPLRDGEKVHIPGAAAAASGAQALTAGTPTALIRINYASALELEALPGVGPSLAQTIIAHRAAHGPFRNFADLDAVRGVGPARLAQWANLISFE
jgi:competence protein ComEA